MIWLQWWKLHITYNLGWFKSTNVVGSKHLWLGAKFGFLFWTSKHSNIDQIMAVFGCVLLQLILHCSLCNEQFLAFLGNWNCLNFVIHQTLITKLFSSQICPSRARESLSAPISWARQGQVSFAAFIQIMHFIPAGEPADNQIQLNNQAIGTVCRGSTSSSSAAAKKRSLCLSWQWKLLCLPSLGNNLLLLYQESTSKCLRQV